jgi:hypothetical protein
MKVSLTPDKNNSYYTERFVQIYEDISVILLRMRSISDKSCRENQDTRLSFPENRVVYETGGKIRYSQTGQR